MQELLSQGFYEMSESEMDEIDGGLGRFSDWMLVGGVTGIVAAGACLAVSTICPAAAVFAVPVLIGGFAGGAIDGAANEIVD